MSSNRSSAESALAYDVFEPDLAQPEPIAPGPFLAGRVTLFLKTAVGLYLVAAAFALAAAAFWVQVRDTADWALLPLILLGVAILIALIALGRAAFRWFIRRLRLGLGIAALDESVREQQRQNRELIRDRDTFNRREPIIYAEGVDEGLKRARGAQDTPTANAMPRKLFKAVGDDITKVVGRTRSPGGVKEGARATLVTIPKGEVVGVLEVVTTSPDGDVQMICTDPVMPTYWNRKQDQDDYRALEGVELVAYDPDRHHSQTLAAGPRESAEED